MKISVSFFFLAKTSFEIFQKCFSVQGNFGSFPLFPPEDYFPPIEAVAAATSVFTEYVFCESVDCAHNTQISSTLQEADCLLKLVKVNKQVFAITLY